MCFQRSQSPCLGIIPSVSMRLECIQRLEEGPASPTDVASCECICVQVVEGFIFESTQTAVVPVVDLAAAHHIVLDWLHPSIHPG